MLLLLTVIPNAIVLLVKVSGYSQQKTSKSCKSGVAFLSMVTHEFHLYRLIRFKTKNLLLLWVYHGQGEHLFLGVTCAIEPLRISRLGVS